MSPWQVRSLDTGPKKCLGKSGFLEGATEHAVEFRDVLGAAVGQPAVALAPDILSRVEFRSIRREELVLDPGMLSQEVLHCPAAVDRALVPEQDQGAAKMLEQVPEKSSDIQAVEASGLKANVQGHAAPSGRHRQGTDRGDMSLLVVIPGIGRLALGCLRPLEVGNEQEAALVEKDQVRTQPFSLFLSGATCSASTWRWPARLAAELDAPAAESSSPSRAATTRHGWGGTGPGTACESTRQSAPASIHRSGIRGAELRRASGAPIAASVPERADTGALEWAQDEVLPSPAAGTSPSTGIPNSWRIRSAALLPTYSGRSPATERPPTGASPTAWLSRGVSCTIGYP